MLEAAEDVEIVETISYYQMRLFGTAIPSNLDPVDNMDSTSISALPRRTLDPSFSSVLTPVHISQPVDNNIPNSFTSSEHTTDPEANRL
jgi:hypothetical protein